MRILIILTFSLFISILAIGQEKDLDEWTVGFNCGISSKPTKLVEKMSGLVRAKKYNEIAFFLKAENTGERYLSIIILERLSDNGLYTLTELQKMIILRMKSSKAIVSNCSGCFVDTHSMEEMFRENNFIGEKDWLDKMIPTK